jgi:uncharacterized protein YkwD
MTDRPPIARRALSASACLVALLAGAARAAEPPPPRCLDDFERTVVELVNDERAARSLAGLAVDLRLMEAAQRHSADMAANDFLSHTGSDGSTPEDRIEDAGYLAWNAWGENAAAGYPTPADVVAGWMGSTGHRANILNAVFDHTGVGYATGAGTQYTHYWTQVFGSANEPAASPLGICPQCSDGVDNDADGRPDYGEDAQCRSDPWGTRERARACGLGFELALLLPLLRARRRR